MDAILKQRLVEAQRDEISEHPVYLRLAKREKDVHNRFGEMAGLSLGVATISFLISDLLLLWLGVEA